MKVYIRWIYAMLLVVLSTACGMQSTAEVLPATNSQPTAVDATGETTALTIAAAADLTPAFAEIGRLFEEQTGIKVVIPSRHDRQGHASHQHDDPQPHGNPAHHHVHHEHNAS